MPQILTLQPGFESRVYALTFSANLAAGETIATVVSIVDEPTGQLNITTEGISSDGKSALVRINAEDAEPNSYKITGRVVTSEGNKLEGDGILLVKKL